MSSIKKIKIAFFSPSFRGGGSENILVELANSFYKKNDYSIKFLVVEFTGPVSKKIDKNIEIIDFNQKSVFKSLLKLIKYIRSQKPDIIISSMTHCNITVAIAKLLSLTKVKLILRECALIDFYQPLSFKSPKFFLMRVLIKFLYNKADSIVSNSQDLAEDLEKKFKLKNIITIHNGYDIDYIKELSREKIELKFPKNIKTIIAIARLSEQKGLDTLIKAFKIAKEKINCRLVILGDGSDLKELKSLTRTLNIEESVLFLGYKINPFPYLKKSNLFILSSLFEGLPGSLIQALIIGTPIVSTNCKFGPREILKNGTLGTLVPINDENKLARAILNNLSENFEKRNILNEDINRFSLKKSVDSYIELISKLT